MKQSVLLADRYELRALLGSGGMGRVFLGRDRLLERDVAVKILARHLAEDEGAVARFRAEARAAAGLNHPAVVSVFDSGSQGDVQYLVMEHVEGSTLAAVIAERGALPPTQAAAIAGRVATGLAVAHAAGIVHRDVKPGNVMATSDGDIKILDFGIARAVSADTATHTAAILGTVSYLSPEQARGDSAEPRSDLYALGVVLYEMLTGTPPFVADTPLAVAFKHLEEEPSPPSSVNPGVPPELDAIVGRAMAKDPGARYPTAEAFAEDLRAFLGEEPVAALSMAPVPPGDAGEDTGELLERVWDAPPAWRRRALLGALAVVLAALVPLGLGLAGWIGDTERAPATTGDDPRGFKKQKGDEGGLPTPTPSEAGAGATPTTSPKPEPEAAEEDGNDESSGSDEGEEEEAEVEPSPSPSASASPSPSPTASASP